MEKTEQHYAAEVYLEKTLGDTREICAQVTKYRDGYREVQLMICKDGRVNDITGMVCNLLGEKRGGRDHNGDFPVRGTGFSAETDVVERLSWALFEGNETLAYYRP